MLTTFLTETLPTRADERLTSGLTGRPRGFWGALGLALLFGAACSDVEPSLPVDVESSSDVETAPADHGSQGDDGNVPEETAEDTHDADAVVAVDTVSDSDDGPADSNEDTGDDTHPDTECAPTCADLNYECGNNPVCGGSCGKCAGGFDCLGGRCVFTGCIPDCDGRQCGLDPACRTSCGDCETTFMCNDSGQCEPIPPRAPSITRLTASPRPITPATGAVFAATVTDQNGVDDIAGGFLRDPVNGATYGTFSGSDGSYTLELSWSQIHATRAIATPPPEGASRIFEAVFSDHAGNRGTRQVNATLSCGENGEACPR